MSDIDARHRARLALAARVVQPYTGHHAVEAVIVGGSLARGYADHFSDVELGFFWRRPPTVHERAELAQAVHAKHLRLDNYSVDVHEWTDECKIDGVKLDLSHRTLADTQADLDAVLKEADTTLSKQILASVIQTAIPLTGNLQIATWQQQVALYPAALARRMVTENLTLNPWATIAVMAQRNEPYIVYRALGILGERLFGALVGLNHIYHPGFKWMRHTAAEFVLTPTDFVDRLFACYRLPMQQAITQAASLADDVFALAQATLPELNLAAQRRHFFAAHHTPR